MKCVRTACRRTGRWHGLCDFHSKVFCREIGTYTVDSRPVAEHLKRLSAANISFPRIGELAGLAPSTVFNAICKPRVQARTAQKILAVPVPSTARPHRNKNLAPAIGTKRRLQALVAMGYTNQELANLVDYPECQFPKLLFTKKWVSVEVAKRAEDVFNRLQLVPPADGIHARRARARAKRKGWVPPLAWDEDEIDDPNAVPHVFKQKRVSVTEQFRELKELGVSDQAIVDRLNLKPKTLQYLRKVS